jgi:hypothetical protein
VHPKLAGAVRKAPIGVVEALGILHHEASQDEEYGVRGGDFLMGPHEP